MRAVPDNLEPLVIAGTPKEVQAELKQSKADLVVLLAFQHLEPALARRLKSELPDIVKFYLAAARENQEKAVLENLIAALVPRKPVAPRVLKELHMQAAARRQVLESGDWLTAADVARLAGLSDRNPSSQPNKWKRRRLIFTIPHNGNDYFPAYALDGGTGYRPNKRLAEIIEVFDGHKDGWGMAYWFDTPNSYLGGKRPKNLLASKPDRVIEAARDEVRGVAHG